VRGDQFTGASAGIGAGLLQAEAYYAIYGSLPFLRLTEAESKRPAPQNFTIPRQ